MLFFSEAESRAIEASARRFLNWKRKTSNVGRHFHGCMENNAHQGNGEIKFWLKFWLKVTLRGQVLGEPALSPCMVVVVVAQSSLP